MGTVKVVQRHWLWGRTTCHTVLLVLPMCSTYHGHPFLLNVTAKQTFLSSLPVEVVVLFSPQKDKGVSITLMPDTVETSIDFYFTFYTICTKIVVKSIWHHLPFLVLLNHKLLASDKLLNLAYGSTDEQKWPCFRAQGWSVLPSPAFLKGPLFYRVRFQLSGIHLGCLHNFPQAKGLPPLERTHNLTLWWYHFTKWYPFLLLAWLC